MKSTDDFLCMLARVRSVANVGLSSIPIEVEVDVASKGFPGFSIVGLPNKAVDEAKERVKTALVNSGCDFPQKKITVNLAPADLPKEGAAFDLPIAVGILVASGEINWTESDAKAVYYGELSLDGSLRHTKGVLLVGLSMAKEGGVIYVPILAANEAAVVENIKVMPVRNLGELISHLRGEKTIKKLLKVTADKLVAEAEVEFDFSEIAGQDLAKRGLMIAAAGGHNILMSGPPGSGKTMLSRALPGILPELTTAESLEVTRIYSVAGLVSPGESILRRRPFRSPHHSTSLVGLIGGGTRLSPGEVSLAHLGVLFLDEMAEFPRSVMESLRQPMEDGRIVISRAIGRVTYPADFMLVAAVNPCPCGFLGHPRRECRCTSRQILRYKRRISGPIMDRIDLHVNVPAIAVEKLSLPESGASTSKEIRATVTEARRRQQRRFNVKGIFTNSQMKNREVREFCALDTETEKMLKLAIEKFDLSARSYFRLLKVSRTIADLYGSEAIRSDHLAEALQFRDRVF